MALAGRLPHRPDHAEVANAGPTGGVAPLEERDAAATPRRRAPLGSPSSRRRWRR
jgi:hypothetical protein